SQLSGWSLASISPASKFPADVDDLAFAFRFPNLLALYLGSTPIYISRRRSTSVDADFQTVDADYT
ncbi:hypothetical protein KI387_040562, partial [Taxus chinensis]